MRGVVGIFVAVVCSALVGCADDVAPNLRKGAGPGGGDGTTNPDGTPNGPGAVQPTAAESACSSVAGATTLSDAKDARNVSLAGKAVFYKSGAKVVRVLKDGTGKTDVYTDPDLVSSYVDNTTLVMIETTENTTNATIKTLQALQPQVKEGEPAPQPAEFPSFAVAPIGENGQPGAIPGLAAVNTGLNAASAKVFASDDTSFYVIGDQNNTTQIIKYNKADPNQQTTLLTSEAVITHPQYVSSAIWYVMDGQRVFKVAIEDGAAQPPKEVFGQTHSSCNLAVGETALYCSYGNKIEKRDLTGASITDFIDETKSKTPIGFGMLNSFNGSLVARSSAPDAKVQHVIRGLNAAGEEKVLACGRTLVSDLAVDGTHVAWVEANGVYLATK